MLNNTLKILLCVLSLFVSINAQVKDTTAAKYFFEIGKKLSEKSISAIESPVSVFDSISQKTVIDKNLIDSANYYFQKAQLIYKESKSWSKYLECLNEISKNLLRFNSIDSVIFIFKEGFNNTALYSSSIPEYYKYFFKLGALYYKYKQDYNTALFYYKKSISLATGVLPKSSSQLAAYYVALGDCYFSNKQFDSSYFSYSYILDSLNSKEHPNNYHQDRVFSRISKLYIVLGKFEEARDYLQRAIDCYKNDKSKNIPAVYFNDFGNLFQDMGEYDKALEYYLQAIENLGLVLSDDHFELATTYNNIGTIYLEKGDYNKALEYLNKSYYVWKNTYGDDHASLCSVLRHLSLIYYNLNDFTSSLEFAQKALDIAIKHYNDNHQYLVDYYNTAALVYGKTNNFEKAVEYLNKNLAFIKDDKDRIKDPDIAICYLHLGDLHLEKGIYNKAVEYYNNALNLQSHFFGSHHPRVAKTNNTLGEIFSKKNEFEKSIKYYDAALKCLGYNISKSNPNNSMNSTILDYNIFKSLKGKVYSLKKLYEKNKNIDTLELCTALSKQCIDLFIKLRHSYKSDSSKVFITENSFNIFDLGIETALELNRYSGKDLYKDSAFEIIEKSKNGLLQGVLANNKARKISGIPDSLLFFEDKLRLQIEGYKILVSQELENEKPDSVKIGYWQNKLFSLNEDFLNYIDELESHYPQYHNLKYKQNTISITEIQKKIDDETSLVEYFIGENSIYIVTISKSAFDLTTIPVTNKFEETVTNFLKILQKQGNLIQKKNHELFLKFSADIYDFIISPILDKISDKKHLIVIPDGKLYYIPFEALIKRSNKTGKFSEYNYLVKDYEVTYHYSATLCFEHDNKEEKDLEKYFIGFAPMFNDSLETNFISKNRSKVKESLARIRSFDHNSKNQLVFAEAEVRSINELFKNKGKSSAIYLHNEAGELDFREVSSKFQCKYLHIATHGIVNEIRPNLSALLFTQLSDTSLDKDGILYAEEILNLNINAGLVVLSACESGVGKVVKGEGMMAINRSFLYSGVKEVMFSLWKVNDKQTCNLMIEFYKNVLEGLPHKTALRNAKLKLLANDLSAIPSNWSAFILFGK